MMARYEDLNVGDEVVLHHDEGDIEGEVMGNTLTFTEGSNIIRIDCAERIAAGSGSYRIYLKRDSGWMPADLNDRGKATIGAKP